MRKRYLALLFTFVFICMAASIAFAAKEAVSFRFPESGRLKVMLYADAQDIHYGNPFLAEAVADTLDTEQPDLVLLLGDQVDGSIERLHLGDQEKYVKATIDHVMAPIVSRNIPFAVVFGNHDSESGVSREWQMAYYKTFPGCLAVDEGDALPGCGTYHIPVYNSDGSKIVLDLCMIDSLDYDETGDYACVSREQVEWFSDTAYDVPTYVFQHIIVGEIYDILTPTAKQDENAFAGKGNGAGRYFQTNSEAILDGGILEAPSPSGKNEGQFAGWVANGNVIAAFFGHDHVNTFTVKKDGIQLIMAPGSTYSSYNDSGVRGARMLVFDEDTPDTFETYLVNYAARGEGQGLSAIPYFFLASNGNSTLGAAFVKTGLPIIVLLLLIVILLITSIFKAVKRKKKKAARA
ncbi:MAG: metallophosphoesterase [Eubacteriales bacterium]|nr:metallophosphoesterase [Eubacteriales bacterium]